MLGGYLERLENIYSTTYVRPEIYKYSENSANSTDYIGGSLLLTTILGPAPLFLVTLAVCPY